MTMQNPLNGATSANGESNVTEKTPSVTDKVTGVTDKSPAAPVVSPAPAKPKRAARQKAIAPKSAPGKAKAATAKSATTKATAGKRTLVIDIGGSKVKMIVLGADGLSLTERTREETPQPATPAAVLKLIDALVQPQGHFDRISVGFPGVVRNGVVKTAANLDKSFSGFDLKAALEARFKKPVRVENDADVQGYGIVEGKGIEVVLTLGTGLGSSLFHDGACTHLELAHHPFRKNQTYEEQLGNRALEKVGEVRWNKRVRKMIESVERLFNYDVLYIGGGNSKLVIGKLPPNVHLANNEAGLTGGIYLWQ